MIPTYRTAPLEQKRFAKALHKDHAEVRRDTEATLANIFMNSFFEVKESYHRMGQCGPVWRQDPHGNRTSNGDDARTANH